MDSLQSEIKQEESLSINNFPTLGATDTPKVNSIWENKSEKIYEKPDIITSTGICATSSIITNKNKLTDNQIIPIPKIGFRNSNEFDDEINTYNSDENYDDYYDENYEENFDDENLKNEEEDDEYY